MSAQTLQREWHLIEQWLATHAPKSLAALRGPAMRTELENAERDLGFPLCDELAALLSQRNGTITINEDAQAATAGFFLPGRHRLLSLRDITQTRAHLNATLEDLGEEMIGEWWHPMWVPFAQHIAADALFIDHSPGATYGHVGIFEHEESSTILPLRLSELIHQFSQSITNGTALMNRLPEITEERLTWKIPSL